MAETEKRKFSETIDEDLDAADDEATKRAAKAKILHAYDDEMSFPRAKVGMLIGPKGSNVKEIMRQSGCKIVVDQRGEGGDVMIYFRQDTASKEGIQLAKTLIAKLLGEGCTFLRAEDERTNATTKGVSMIKCPHERVGILIGAKGQTIQDIKQRSGARISVANDKDPHMRLISISGTPRQVQEAAKLVELVIRGGPGMLSEAPPPTKAHTSAAARAPLRTHLDAHHVIREMEIASDRVAVVIGSRGLVLSEIKSRSRCKIVITQDVSASSTSKVLFTGMQDDIDFAMELVQRVVNEGPKALTSAEECIVETISISSSFVGKVLGVQGSTIKEIQKRCLVRMKIEEDAQGSDQRALVINGEPANVKSAVDLTYQVLEMGAEFAFANSQPSPPQHLPLMLPHHMTHAPINSLPLGADGTAGALFPAEPLTEAMFAQIAQLRAEVVGRVVGKAGACLELIKNKSGASIVISKPDVHNHCKVHIMGSFDCTALAAKMVQELLINGPSRLQAMPDVPFSVPMGYVPVRSTALARPMHPYPMPPPMSMQQQQQQQQHQHYYVNHMHHPGPAMYSYVFPSQMPFMVPVPVNVVQTNPPEDEPQQAYVSSPECSQSREDTL